jgi:DNA-binding CsgD family transcriptional regulator
MAAPKSLASTLAELRAAAARQRRVARMDPVPALARLMTACCVTGVEDRTTGVAFRLEGETEQGSGSRVTVVLQTLNGAGLTATERAVADLLCEGHTRAQIARLRGVTTNTIKSQIRQVFRKLDVDSRVDLVRRWCP